MRLEKYLEMLSSIHKESVVRIFKEKNQWKSELDRNLNEFKESDVSSDILFTLDQTSASCLTAFFIFNPIQEHLLLAYFSERFCASDITSPLEIVKWIRTSDGMMKHCSVELPLFRNFHRINKTLLLIDDISERKETNWVFKLQNRLRNVCMRELRDRFQ